MKIVIGYMVVIFCLPFTSVGQIEISRAEAARKYKEYSASNLKEPRQIGWNGTVDNCNEGAISTKVQKKALMRINYFRTLCGLKQITFATEFNRLAQKAAYVIFVNNQLSHYPDENWKCYSEEAMKAASHSSLGFSAHYSYPETAFVSGFIEDLGNDNIGVPHRRSMLYSRATTKGYGATFKTEAIYNDYISWNKKDTTQLPKYFSYPVPGYNEIDLVYPRWSFSIPDSYTVDFSEVIVELRNEAGKQIKIEVLEYEEIYDPTIVWELREKVSRESMLKESFTVSIKNVLVNGSIRNYDYKVRFFDFE